MEVELRPSVTTEVFRSTTFTITSIPSSFPLYQRECTDSTTGSACKYAETCSRLPGISHIFRKIFEMNRITFLFLSRSKHMKICWDEGKNSRQFKCLLDDLTTADSIVN